MTSIERTREEIAHRNRVRYMRGYNPYMDGFRDAQAGVDILADDVAGSYAGRIDPNRVPHVVAIPDEPYGPDLWCDAYRGLSLEPRAHAFFVEFYSAAHRRSLTGFETYVAGWVVARDQMDAAFWDGVYREAQDDSVRAG